MFIAAVGQCHMFARAGPFTFIVDFAEVIAVHWQRTVNFEIAVCKLERCLTKTRYLQVKEQTRDRVQLTQQSSNRRSAWQAKISAIRTFCQAAGIEIAACRACVATRPGPVWAKRRCNGGFLGAQFCAGVCDCSAWADCLGRLTINAEPSHRQGVLRRHHSIRSGGQAEVGGSLC